MSFHCSICRPCRSDDAKVTRFCCSDMGLALGQNQAIHNEAGTGCSRLASPQDDLPHRRKDACVVGCVSLSLRLRRGRSIESSGWGFPKVERDGARRWHRHPSSLHLATSWVSKSLFYSKRTCRVGGNRSIAAKLSFRCRIFTFAVFVVSALEVFLGHLSGSAFSSPSNKDSFDLIERDFVGRSVVEFSRSRRLVGGDGLGVLDGAAVFQISGDAGRTEGVAASGGG